MEDDETIEHIVRRIRSLGLAEFVDIGSLPEAIARSWPDAVSDRVVVTGERYRHFLDRHPELAGQEQRIIEAALDPDAVHANIGDPMIAILYKTGTGKAPTMRLALWVSSNSHLKNSIHSARYAHADERVRGEKAGRSKWARE